MYIFFFFKQKTAYEMRISDWSSDVCSSDLISTGMVALSYQSLLTTLNANEFLTKERTVLLARVLASSDIGLEPDILNGSKMPKSEDTVVLFATPAADPIRPTPEYQLAALTLQIGRASCRERVCQYV